MGKPYSPALYNAAYYERIGRWSNSEKYLKELDELLRKMEITRADRLLDVGCGPGATLRHVAARYHCEAVGVDYPAEWMDLHPRLAARASATALPFADASFSKAVLIHVIGHLPDPVGSLGEVRRVLRPGGKIGVITPNRGFVYLLRPWNLLRIIPYTPDPTVLRYFSRRSLSETVSAAGFPNPTVLYSGAHAPLPGTGSFDFLRERLTCVAEKS